MDYQQVDDIIRLYGFASEPAFTDVIVSIHDIPPDMNAIGLYYPGSGTIVIPPDGQDSVFLHELGHRYGDYYYENLSEQFAEQFRHRYQYGQPYAAFGRDISYVPYRRTDNAPVYQIGSSSFPIVPFAVLGGLAALLALTRSR